MTTATMKSDPHSAIANATPGARTTTRPTGVAAARSAAGSTQPRARRRHERGGDGTRRTDHPQVPARAPADDHQTRDRGDHEERALGVRIPERSAEGPALRSSRRADTAAIAAAASTSAGAAMRLKVVRTRARKRTIAAATRTTATRRNPLELPQQLPSPPSRRTRWRWRPPAHAPTEWARRPPRGFPTPSVGIRRHLEHADPSGQTLTPDEGEQRTRGDVIPIDLRRPENDSTTEGRSRILSRYASRSRTKACKSSGVHPCGGCRRSTFRGASAGTSRSDVAPTSSASDHGMAASPDRR